MTSQPADKSRAKKPGGLLDQYNLLGAIIDTSWATRLDHKVARHIIDRYYPKHGNGRASLRYLERATGSLRPNIIASLRRLAEYGAISMVRAGRGTRPSEFALNFDFPARGIAHDTTSNDCPSGIVGDTAGGIVDDTSTASSGIVGDTESYLQNPAYKAEILIDRVDPAAPTAPPLAGGLAAPAAGGTAVEEEERAPADTKPTFEDLWRTYDHARGKKEARKAWSALPADTNLAAVIESARAWQASWAAQGRPDAPRFTLARWLKDERYDEDAPKGYIKMERGKAKSKSIQVRPAAERPANQTITIATAVEVQNGARKELRISGDGFEHAIVLESDSAEEQESGQAQLERLVDVAGIAGDIQDAAELIGKSVVVSWLGDTPMFCRALPPADEQHAAPDISAAVCLPDDARAARAAPKPKIQQRDIPDDLEGKKAMLDRWRKNGFFEEEAA